MYKTILTIILGAMIPCVSYASTYNGKCSNSYFIEKNMNILDTMNLLITGAKMNNNTFDCKSFTLFKTDQQEYKVDISTLYNNSPYILEFIGKQTPNNNGLVFIPSDAILINYRTEQVVSHYTADKIIGECNIDTNHIKNDSKLDCLIALNKGNNDTIAVKIHFNEVK